MQGNSKILIPYFAQETSNVCLISSNPPTSSQITSGIEEKPSLLVES